MVFYVFQVSSAILCQAASSPLFVSSYPAVAEDPEVKLRLQQCEQELADLKRCCEAQVMLACPFCTVAQDFASTKLCKL